MTPALLLLFLAAPRSGHLPAPVEATAADIVIPPSPAVRAATLGVMAKPPALPVTVRLACDISPYTGEPRRCVPAGDLARLRTWADFDVAAAAFEAAPDEGGGDGAARAAYERVRTLRARPSADERSRKLMAFTLVVAAADGLPPLPPAETLAEGEVAFEEPALTSNQLYPETALRNEDQARVAVNCRVQADRALLCRDAQIEPSGQLRPSTARLFVLLTYQLMSLRRAAPLTRDGRPTVARDVVLKANWRLVGT